MPKREFQSLNPPASIPRQLDSPPSIRDDERKSICMSLVPKKLFPIRYNISWLGDTFRRDTAARCRAILASIQEASWSQSFRLNEFEGFPITRDLDQKHRIIMYPRNVYDTGDKQINRVIGRQRSKLMFIGAFRFQAVAWLLER